MHVLHAYSGNRFGGAETYLLTLARNQELCHDMQSSFALCFEGELASQLRDLGNEPYVLGNVRLSRPWSVWRVRRSMRKLLREIAPDIVLCHSCWPQAVFGPAVLREGIPLAFRSTDLPRGGQWLEKLASRVQPIAVVANSRQTAEAVSRHLYTGIPVQVIHEPVDNRLPRDRESVRKSIRLSLGATPEEVVILLASRLVPLKGLHILTKALGLLPLDGNWSCWIAGGPQDSEEEAYLSSLKKFAASKGIADRIHFLGQRRDVPDLLCAADIYCQPNTEPDAFGIVLIEALQAGLPVITSGMGGPLEIVDETCGIFVEPGDVGAVADALVKLMDDRLLRQKLSQGGPSRANSLAEPARQMRILCDALRDAATGGPG